MTLSELLDEGAAFDAEYAGGLSNHLPMALLALARLGATEARLNAFAQSYSSRLQPAPPHAIWPAGDAWASRLGERVAWPEYRSLFGDWLLHEHASEVLRQTLPLLMQGCGAAAFHGLIRTAYALQSTRRQELADALAYWACRWLDLGTAGSGGNGCTGGTVREPEAVLRRLHATASDAGLIFQRMQAAAREPHFQAVVATLVVHESTLAQLALLAAQAYAASGNFTALHLVTSAHATRLLLPCLDDPLPALAGYWRAFAAAVCASGMTADTAPAPKPKPWPELVAAAVASDDDHVIKLVDSCREEQRACGGGDGGDGDGDGGGGPWQQAATRAV